MKIYTSQKIDYNIKKYMDASSLPMTETRTDILEDHCSFLILIILEESMTKAMI